MFGEFSSRDRQLSHSVSNPRSEPVLERDSLDEFRESNHSLSQRISTDSTEIGRRTNSNKCVRLVAQSFRFLPRKAQRFFTRPTTDSDSL